MQTKKVHIREEPSDRGWDVVLVDLVEDESYVIFHLGWCSFSECDEQVDRIRVDAGAFILLSCAKISISAHGNSTFFVELNSYVKP